MTHLRYLGEEYCEVFDHGFMPGEVVGRRDLTDEQLATLAANPQFEAVAEEASQPEGAPPAKAAKPCVASAKQGKPRKKAKPRGRPFPKRPPSKAGHASRSLMG